MTNTLTTDHLLTNLTPNTMPATSGRRLRLFGLLALLLLTFSEARQARASHDVVEFFNTINVPKNESIHDAVCFFCSVDVKGSVDGDMVVFFGQAKIEGEAKHDVVVIFGSVRMGEGATIGRDLVNIFGSTRMAENTRIGHDTVVLLGSLSAEESASFGGDRVVQPTALMWIPIILIVGIIMLISAVRGSYRRRQRRFMRGY